MKRLWSGEEKNTSERKEEGGQSREGMKREGRNAQKVEVEEGEGRKGYGRGEHGEQRSLGWEKGVGGRGYGTGEHGGVGYGGKGRTSHEKSTIVEFTHARSWKEKEVY